MSNRLFLFSCALPLAALLLLFSGCGFQRPQTDPAMDKKAFTRSMQIRSLNSSIAASKGVGRATITSPEQTDRFKIAWAAVHPNRIRITFLLSGVPVETIVADGERITFLSHTGSHPRHSYKSGDPNMEKYIHVPVRLSEIIMILLGRFPINEFEDAYFSPENEDPEKIVLRCSREYKLQQLGFDTTGQLNRIDLTDFSGEPFYTLSVQQYMKHGKQLIPSRIIISDRPGRTLQLEILKFEANPPIKEGIFRLTESGS